MDKLVSDFYRDGFVVIPDVLNKEQCEVLKKDIDSLKDQSKIFSKNNFFVKHCMFENSEAHLQLFEQEPVVDLAEKIIRDGIIQQELESHKSSFTRSDSTLECHVFHNSAIVTQPGSDGISQWHQDDPPHYIVLDDNPPKNVHLPVLALTANYFLTDVTDISNGPTSYIAGSHLFGKSCPTEIDETKYDVSKILLKAGSVILFNCQVWHKGNPNTSEKTRYVSQVSYGRRMIGHKYYPFMNYNIPSHVLDYISDKKRLKRLVGFLHHGPYG